MTHRDLKPPNILLASKRDVSCIKIVDFGCGKTAEDDMTTDVGTPLYKAPELLFRPPGNPYTCAVDLWSAGVILFFL